MTNSHELKSIDFPVHRYPTLIRERHLDSFGHVNNAQYMVLFEEARWEMISSRGYGLEEVKKSQVGTVVLECRIRFKRELRLREEVVIATQLYEISKKTAIIRHEILKKDGSVAAEAFFTMGCFDLSLRRLLSPTSAWLAAVTGKMP